MRAVDKKNEARYDHTTELYVGPPSKPLMAAEVAQSEYLICQPAIPEFSNSHSPLSLALLADRCSTKSIQCMVKEKMGDVKTVEALRKRMLDWSKSEADESQQTLPETSGTKRKRSQRGMAKEVEEREKMDEALQDIDAVVPNAFRFLTHPHLFAYYERGGLLDQSCIKQPTPTRLLTTSRRKVVEGEDGQSKPSSEKAKSKTLPPHLPLVLSISVFARTVRGMWAKERLHQMASRSEVSMEEIESESSDADLKEKEDSRLKKGERGLYGPLQLVQKLDILSNATLQDLREAILCRMDDLPEMSKGEEEQDNLSLPQYTGQKRSTDSCFFIEDRLYSERSGQKDGYGELLEKSINAAASSTPMDQVSLQSISFCTGKLYWFLHQGSCEHLWVVNSMRAVQREESTLAFPLATFYACGAVQDPLAKWCHPRSSLNIQYSLDKCDLCKSLPAKMVLLGGSRFQSSQCSSTNVAGLKQDTTAVCQICWSALRGVPPTSLVDYTPTSCRTHWTLIPSMD